MIIFRCRRFGQADWTEISINGEAERSASSCIGASLSGGSFDVQYMDEEGEWIDLAEMEFDDD